MSKTLQWRRNSFLKACADRVQIGTFDNCCSLLRFTIARTTSSDSGSSTFTVSWAAFLKPVFVSRRLNKRFVRPTKMSSGVSLRTSPVRSSPKNPSSNIAANMILWWSSAYNAHAWTIAAVKGGPRLGASIFLHVLKSFHAVGTKPFVQGS